MMNAGLTSRPLPSRTVLLLLALTLGTAPVLRAQTPVFPFEHFPEVSPFVFDLHQDHEGFLWIASAEGLYRYDGYRFRGLGAPAGGWAGGKAESQEHA